MACRRRSGKRCPQDFCGFGRGWPESARTGLGGLRFGDGITGARHTPLFTAGLADKCTASSAKSPPDTSPNTNRGPNIPVGPRRRLDPAHHLWDAAQALRSQGARLSRSLTMLLNPRSG